MLGMLKSVVKWAVPTYMEGPQGCTDGWGTFVQLDHCLYRLGMRRSGVGAQKLDWV